MSGFRIGVTRTVKSDPEIKLEVRWNEEDFDPAKLRAELTGVLAEAFLEIDKRESK